MKKVYLYPLSARTTLGVVNPYIANLRDALSEHFEVVNAGRPSKSGIFDILRYLRNTDVVYLNWGEEVPENSYGRIQGFFLLILMQYLKRSPIFIIWTLHNKSSHYSEYRWLKKRLYHQMLKKSDLIITHAKEGLDLIPAGKAACFRHHPVKELLVNPGRPNAFTYDIIIWGTIYPYKGIHTFLNYLEENGSIEKYKILIAGKIITQPLAVELQAYHEKYKNIELIDGFIEKEQLIEYVQASRITLFTYHSDSILSSGVLMDSLTYGARIVGPAVGAFRDLNELGLIETYIDFPSLISAVDRELASNDENPARREKLSEFILANSWHEFSKTLLKLIEEKSRTHRHESNN